MALQIEQSGPEWALGCEHCRYGVKQSPASLGGFNLRLERLAQLREGLLEPCDCKAGIAMVSSLLALERQYIEEGRSNVLTSIMAAQGFHWEIEAARKAVREANEKGNV